MEVEEHREGHTAAATCRTTSAGGSTVKLSGCPLSVTTLKASTTVHLSLAQVVMNAAAGPYTLLHGLGALMRIGSLTATVLNMVHLGCHVSHTAMAHCPMGSSCASNAGSAFPLGPPSVSIN